MKTLEHRTIRHCSGEYFKEVNVYGKWQHLQRNVKLCKCANTDYKQSTEATKVKPTLGTARGTQLSSVVVHHSHQNVFRSL